MSKQRLFIGTFLDPADKKKLGQLSAHDEKLAQLWQTKLRWVRPEKLHLTWIFLGLLEQGQQEEIGVRLAGCLEGQSCLSLSYTRTVFWPDNRRPRHLVVVPDSVPRKAAELGLRLRSEFSDIAQRDEHEFNPHITLINFEHGYRREIAIPDWFNVDEQLPIAQNISKVCLIESHLGSGGDYEVLKSFDLDH